MPPEQSTATESQPLDAELRKDLRKQFAMFLPMLVTAMLGVWLQKWFENDPETVVLILFPGIVVQVFILLRAATRKKFVLGWPFLVFLSIYILTFYFAAETSVLDWKRTLVGYDDQVPSNFLALNYYGDWHYRVLSEKPAFEKLVIVLMKPPKTKQQGRVDIANLLAIAKDSGAVGVAVDSYFENYMTKKGDEETGIDSLLCSRFQQAREAGLKVFVAYDVEVKEGHADRSAEIDPDLNKCVPESDQGHMVGYAERDGKIRSIPLYLWRDDPTSGALSLKIANALKPELNPPDQSLLQFTEPRNKFPEIPFEEIDAPDEESSNLDEENSKLDRARSILRGRFILAGENSAQDSFRTPFGVQRGVVIHAYAVQSLLQNRFIRRPPWGLSLFPIAIWCYLLMVLTARGWGNLKLILINLAISILVAAGAALLMQWLIWIDLIYPFLAAWIFLLLLLALRKIAFSRMKLISLKTPSVDA